MTTEQYFAAPGVSNSALNKLQDEINPTSRIFISQGAFKFGKLFESRVQDAPQDYSSNIVELGEPGNNEKIERMYRSFASDSFSMTVMQRFDRQVAKFGRVDFNYNGISFSLNCKCLFDWYLEGWGGGDLKTFSGRDFMAACKRFRWIESRVFYMLVAGSKKDFIIGVSKDDYRTHKLMINRGDNIYNEAYASVCKKAYDYFILKY